MPCVFCPVTSNFDLLNHYFWPVSVMLLQWVVIPWGQVLATPTEHLPDYLAWGSGPRRWARDAAPSLRSGRSLISLSVRSCRKARPPSRPSAACSPSPPTRLAWRPAPASTAAAGGPRRSWERALRRPPGWPPPTSRRWPPGQPPSCGVPPSSPTASSKGNGPARRTDQPEEGLLADLPSSPEQTALAHGPDLLISVVLSPAKRFSHNSTKDRKESHKLVFQ